MHDVSIGADGASNVNVFDPGFRDNGLHISDGDP